MNVYEINYEEPQVDYVYTKTKTILAETFEIALAKLKLLVPNVTIIGGRLIAFNVIL